MKAVIMAGGLGTRIAQVNSSVPKPMIEILGKPILQYQIENLRSCGIKDIILVVGHMSNVIVNHFGRGKAFGVKIEYFTEDEPLGTAGALFKMTKILKKDFLLLCGDTIFDIDFSCFIRFHKKHNALATLICHPNSHPYDSSLVETKFVLEKEGDIPKDTYNVVRWFSKQENASLAQKGEYIRNLVNAGIQIISPRLLDYVKKEGIVDIQKKAKIDLDKDVLKPAVKTKRLFAYITTEYIKDMGTPDRYESVVQDIELGVVRARNLLNKQKAVFLDRDGTINKQKGFMKNAKDMELLPGVAEAIRKMNQKGFLAVVATNQPVIARGEADFCDLFAIHNKMEYLLGKEGAYLDAIYYCPHHTDRGFLGERMAYKCACKCRKPKIGLLIKAKKDLNIDMKQSYMVGDSPKDMECGKKAKCKKTVLLTNGYSLLDFVNEYL